jgi:hypothetical protein
VRRRHAYADAARARDVARLLREDFDIPAVVVDTTVEVDVPAMVGQDPMDLDEAADYVDSHWDREADDRELRRGRHGVRPDDF